MRYYYSIPIGCIEGIKSDLEGADCFRITKNSPPAQKDFCPQLFMIPPQDRVIADPCKFCGASVFTNFAYAKEQIKRFKKLGSYLFKGHVQSSIHGPLVNTGMYHYNWYQYEGIDPTVVFGENVYEL